MIGTLIGTLLRFAHRRVDRRDLLRRVAAVEGRVRGPTYHGSAQREHLGHDIRAVAGHLPGEHAAQALPDQVDRLAVTLGELPRQRGHPRHEPGHVPPVAAESPARDRVAQAAQERPQGQRRRVIRGETRQHQHGPLAPGRAHQPRAGREQPSELEPGQRLPSKRPRGGGRRIGAIHKKYAPYGRTVEARYRVSRFEELT